MTAPTFDAYAAENPDARFTEWLRARAEPEWTNAVEHQFVEELGAGTLDEDAFSRYLVQDYAFVETLTGLVGHTVGHAPTMHAKGQLADFLGTLTADENDYFQRSFEALSIPTEEYENPQREPVTMAFEDLLTRAATEGGYAEALSVLLPAEWVYLSWGQNVADTNPDPFYYREWIDLHAISEFEAFVEWMRRELDRYGPELSDRRQSLVERHFRRVVDLEVSFFDLAYELE
ncbi:transcriptional activator, TenA family protein [Haloferax elongans ATCC BAA-1513]|uniref:Transcriptional activator, TenA family protein n=1 Tax=Haloferax elongans ATCC BAA-1513 TaxID=1230453 RepID=M0H8Z5_HALEO|nr:TenA family protein [Haloferax elongans]ELZ80283.1 transcriptional activator, TenA family protein [Haloferax elongans ATCC BAA-1513]